jgi:hypothetical protein
MPTKNLLLENGAAPFEAKVKLGPALRQLGVEFGLQFADFLGQRDDRGIHGSLRGSDNSRTCDKAAFEL